MTARPDLQSLEITLATLAFVLCVLPRRRRTERDDVMTSMQAVVLRVEEEGGTRMVRAPVPITIGRAPSATLVVPDARVSRLHARIDSSDGVLCVRDLDSRNGTLLNARPIEAPQVLRPGDEIDVGVTRIVFCGVGSWK